LSQEKTSEKLKRILKRIEAPLQSLRSSSSHFRSKIGRGSTKPQIFAYNLLGEKTARLQPLFKDLDANLQKSGMKTSFKGYVSLTLFSTALAMTSASVIVPIFAILILHLSLFLSLLYTIGALLFTAASSIIGFYIYPIVKKDNLKRNLEDSLPFTTGYLSILAGAGVPPSQMFRALAKTDSKLAISQEARNIVRDVELFGVDIITAMDMASKRTPSEKFQDLLEGFIATMHSGGDLRKYLSERSRQYMRLKRIALKRLADSLSVLAEFYVVMLVAGPLILVVMLAVMAMIGGSMLGLMNPRLLLYMLTYLGLPVGSTAFLLILDMISPKR
jgi:flagellar protein FlaJ